MALEALVGEVLIALNSEPRFDYYGGHFKDSYELAAALDKALKEQETKK